MSEKTKLVPIGTPAVVVHTAAEPVIDVTMPPRRPMRKTIVKVQLPITKVDPLKLKDGEVTSPVLIYNEDRAIMFQSVTASIYGRFRKGEKKLYFHAEISEDGTVEIGERAPVQSW